MSKKVEPVLWDWIYHPSPFPDELLSSWLGRIAKTNGTSAHSFCKLVWPEIQVWTRDIDTLSPIEILQQLSRQTSTPFKSVKATTFREYEGVLFDSVNTKGPTRWINHIGIYHRARKRPGLQWCPICLKEDSVPYFRKCWRLSLSTCCQIHKIILTDKCCECGTPAAPHRILEPKCYHCGRLFHDHPAVKVDPSAYELESSISAALNGRVIGLKDNVSIDPYLYFKVLYHILNMLIRGSRAARLRTATGQLYGIPLGVSVRSPKKTPLEAHGTLKRHCLMGLAARLLNNWPEHFIESCRISGNSWTWVKKEIAYYDFPFALLSVADFHLSIPANNRLGFIDINRFN